MSTFPPMRASLCAHACSSSDHSPLSSRTYQLLLPLLPPTPPGRNPLFPWLAITTWRAKPLFARLRSSQDLYSSFPLKKRLSEPGSDEDEDEDEDEDDVEQDARDVAAGEYDLALSDQDADEGGEEEEDEEDQGEEEIVSDSVVASTSGFEGRKSQRVARFLSDVREFGDSIIDFKELAGIYEFPVDKFQRLAIQAFLGGSSVVVSAPTSSGKTLIAEAAAAATVARGRRIFYTTPLKALSNQKYRDFRETFGESCVGLLTGDSAVNRDAQILIMTTEILRNMLYQSVGKISYGSGLSQVDVIILDEVHYLSDISRGTVWEEIVIYCPKEVQLICLSATVANPDELAGWMDTIHGMTELITTSRRPVPLIWHFSLKNGLSLLLDKKCSRMNRKLSLGYLQVSNLESKVLKENGARRSLRKRRNDNLNDTSATNISRCAPLSKNDINIARRSQVPQIRDTIQQLKAKNMLPAIWFIFSRKGCDAAVQYLDSFNLLDECEASEVALALKRFKIQYPDAVRESSIRGILQGVAAHHAGCLPLWKSFVEELFQRGLLKVVFATETLAAGINMPARTAVISSISKRNESGRALLSSNELHQMAGRAGRRGIDKEGYVVFVQTAYEGAEECCDILFSGLEPLVSQFKASYGMVLNLLAGEKLTHRAKESDEVNTIHPGRTLDEARKLIEQSFGNYVGSSVMLAAKEELQKIQHEIEYLSSEVTNEAIDRKCQEQLSNLEYCEISHLQEKMRVEKWQRTVIRRRMELKWLAGWKPVLNECENGQLPFICLQYNDNGVPKIVPAVYLTSLQPLEIPQILDMINVDSLCTNTMERNDYEEIDERSIIEPQYYIALGSDNSWYLFTEKWIRAVYKTGFPDVPSVQDDNFPKKILREFIAKNNLQWEKLAHSEFGGLWCAEGSLETWSWSLNIPILSSLSEDNEVRPWTQAYQDDVELYREQKSKVSYLKKKISATNGFKEFKKILDMARFTKEKIERLEARSNRLIKRIDQIEPSGWKEFLQVRKHTNSRPHLVGKGSVVVSENIQRIMLFTLQRLFILISSVIHEARALDINTHVMFPLGETASIIRGENELWLAMVLRNKILLDLKPAQLASVCGSLVSEGIKIRPWKSDSYMYEPSITVSTVIELLEKQRCSFLQLQDKHGVKVPCDLDIQFSGMVEAWASGLTWREIMMDCAMDEGDLARLLRRTIDLLNQIPKLPDIDPLLQQNAKLASNVMDRTPINEFAG